MKIVFNQEINIQRLMRRCGYFFERLTGEEMIFIRFLTQARSGYPRFHAYITQKQSPRETVINLHLDQKKPIYKGSAAHAGEYDGEIIEKEVERIKNILGPIV